MFVRQMGLNGAEEFWDFYYVHSVDSCAGPGGKCPAAEGKNSICCGREMAAVDVSMSCIMRMR